MKKLLWCFSMLAVFGAPLLAQSSAKRPESIGEITQTVRSSDRGASDLKPANAKDSAVPPIINVLTVIGDDLLGVPCLDCLLGILFPTIGLPEPLGKVIWDNNYQIDSDLVDNSYTGSCTFTFVLRDVNKNIVVSKTQTFTEKARTDVLLSAPVTIPANTPNGLGSVSTTAVCGSSTTQSKSNVFIACVQNPPYCF